jgi:phosphopantetheine adenylyltransferase
VIRNLDFDKRRKKKKEKEKEKKFGNSKPRHFQKEMAEAKREYNLKNEIETWKMTSKKIKWKMTSSTTKKSTLIGCDIKVNVPSLSSIKLR